MFNYDDEDEDEPAQVSYPSLSANRDTGIKNVINTKWYFTN